MLHRALRFRRRLSIAGTNFNNRDVPRLLAMKNSDFVDGSLLVSLFLQIRKMPKHC
jgi:hypothetical protein